jgi:hypothetical protein
VRLVRDRVHHARERGEHVDRRPAAARTERAVEHDVAVEDAAHLVGDGLVHVAALDEHRVDGRDRAAVALTGALEQPRQHGEDARRITAPRGRLAGGEAHLALGAREARHRVDEQHHPQAAIAEVLGVRGGDLRGAKPLECRHVARGDDDDALLAAFGAERVIEKLADLSPALADERHDDDVRCSAAGDRAEQGALSDARSGEQAHALSFSEREQAIEHADAGRDGPIDRLSRHRERRIAVDGDVLAAVNRRAAVDGVAEAVDDTPEQSFARLDAKGRAGGFHDVIGTHADERAERHRDRFAAVEPDHFAHERLSSPLDVHDVAHAHAGHHEAQAEARHAEHPPRRSQRGSLRELGAERVEIHACQDIMRR